VVLFVGLMPMKSINATPTTTLYIDPPSIIDIGLTPPQTFKVYLKVADVTGLSGYEYKLYWEKNVIEFVSVHDSVPFGGSPFVATNTSTNNYDATYGQMYFVVVSLSGSVSGSFTLREITFRVKSLGRTSIDIQESILGDPSANNIPHDELDGFFSNQEIRPAIVYVQPPSIIDPGLVSPQTFTVNISIVEAGDLYSYDVKLGYNTTILDVASITEGPFLKGFGTTTINKMQDDPVVGTVWIAISLNPPAPPANGGGTLASITFRVAGKGESNFHLFDTVLKDMSNNNLVHYTSDGYFNNVLLARLYVDPPLIIDPTMTPASTFTIDIKIANITNLYGYEFNLWYDTSFLNGLGILTYPHPSNETHFTSKVVIDDRNGHIFVNVSYYPPAGMITSVPPITLTSIVFQVQSYGASHLHLDGTKLVDNTDTPIVHVTGDGFVSVKAPDVAILEIHADPVIVYSGTGVNIDVIAANLGIFRNETFDVTVYYGTTAIDTVTVTDLPPLTNITLPFSWDTNGVPIGDYLISAEASVVPLETDTANNFLSDGTVQIIAPDVAVLSVSRDLPIVYQGWKTNITVVAQNQGLLPVTFDVTAYYGNNTIGTMSITDLGSGSNKTLVFLWNTTEAPFCHNYTISAKASILPGEVDIADNTCIADGKVKVRIMGDVNGDGTVNILDLILVSKAFASLPGDPNYNMYADLNRDRIINVLDMILVATHLGLQC